MNGNQKRLGVCTLGCKVNQCDTDTVVLQFVQAGYELVDFREQADVYLINTCTVTNLGDRKSRQMIRRAHKQNPRAKIVVMGCLAQVSPAKMQAIPGVSLVVGTSRREGLAEKVAALVNGAQCVLVEDIFQVREFEDLPARDLSGRSRAFLKIQDGCHQFCSYCRVPFARGPSRSREPESVLKQAESFIAQGFQEIVLSGIHLGLYGRDLAGSAWDLAKISREIAQLPGLKRLRIGSVDPHELSDELIALVAQQPVLCRHLHIPLQSGSDAVLRRMKRNYTRGEFLEVVRKVQADIPGVAVTTDLMVGFPGETERDFAETLELVDQLRFSKIHVFQYSRREGTAAAKFSKQVPASVKEDRSKCLIKVSNDFAEAYHRLHLGKEVEVLVERQDAGRGMGHTDNYLRVSFPADQRGSLPGSFVLVQVTAADKEGVCGQLIEEGGGKNE